TPHLSSLNDNLAGLSARYKLRLRWYGDEMTNIQPHLELKQKRNMLGRKKRCLLPRALDLSLPWMEILETIRARAAPDWQVILQTVNQPTLLNHYRREYYVTVDNTTRVTLDFDQVAYDQRFSLRPNLRARLPIADNVVIEIKTSQDQAERLPEITAWFPALRSRNSKYARSLRP
ncbi:MAG: VTC domain-containing protein, partial [Chloroflexota bacterium]|nr:VTC domain-containing protein [Chloroflexota bacterium]